MKTARETADEKILVLVPCYNCEPQVGRVLKQFVSVRPGLVHEVLVLDNGSMDKTVEAACEAAEDVPHIAITVGRNKANYNLGGSHKTAFTYATKNGFTHVAVLHGDDQGNIRDLLPILEAGDHRHFDACLGARFMSGSKLRGYSWFRIFGNHVFNLLFTGGTLRSVKDLGSGLNIFGRSVFQDPRVLHYADDLRFNIYLLLGMFSRNLKTKYFPIEWREDDQVSNVKMTSQALKTLKLLLQSTISGKSFWDREHRDTLHSSYEFSPVYQRRPE